MKCGLTELYCAPSPCPPLLCLCLLLSLTCGVLLLSCSEVLIALSAVTLSDRLSLTLPLLSIFWGISFLLQGFLFFEQE